MTDIWIKPSTNISDYEQIVTERENIRPGNLMLHENTIYRIRDCSIKKNGRFVSQPCKFTLHNIETNTFINFSSIAHHFTILKKKVDTSISDVNIP